MHRIATPALTVAAFFIAPVSICKEILMLILLRLSSELLHLIVIPVLAAPVSFPFH